MGKKKNGAATCDAHFKQKYYLPFVFVSLHISLVDTTGLDHVRVSLHELPANLKSMAKALEMQLMSAAKHLAVS